MMKRIHRDAGSTDGRRDERAWLDYHVVCPLVPCVVSIVRKRVRNARWNVLNQRASEGDVQNLWSAANGKDRFSGLARRQHKRYLSLVSQAVCRSRVFISLLSIKIRVDIFASGQDKSIDGRDDASCSRRAGQWWNDDWYEPC